MGFNIRNKTIKLLEGNRGKNICDFGLSKDFSDRTQKAQTLKEKIR